MRAWCARDSAAEHAAAWLRPHVCLVACAHHEPACVCVYACRRCVPLRTAPTCAASTGGRWWTTLSGTQVCARARATRTHTHTDGRGCFVCRCACSREQTRAVLSARAEPCVPLFIQHQRSRWRLAALALHALPPARSPTASIARRPLAPRAPLARPPHGASAPHHASTSHAPRLAAAAAACPAAAPVCPPRVAASPTGYLMEFGLYAWRPDGSVDRKLKEGAKALVSARAACTQRTYGARRAVCRQCLHAWGTPRSAQTVHACGMRSAAAARHGGPRARRASGGWPAACVAAAPRQGLTAPLCMPHHTTPRDGAVCVRRCRTSSACQTSCLTCAPLLRAWSPRAW